MGQSEPTIPEVEVILTICALSVAPLQQGEEKEMEG